MYKRVAVFVDGENFRNTLCDLFPIVKSQDWYLPRTDWGSFLDVAVKNSLAELGFKNADHELMRCYWYVVGEFEFSTYFDAEEFSKLPLAERLEYFLKYAKGIYGDPKALSNDKKKHQCADRCLRHLQKQQKVLWAKEERWKTIQDGIQKATNKLEFRKFGHIYVTLEKLKFHQEKGTDVKLAIDLVQLKDSYDVAILISGDADYLPAVAAAKAAGKHVVNIDFLDQSAQLLPGGARKLKMHCDATWSIPYEEMRKLMGINPPNNGSQQSAEKPVTSSLAREAPRT